MEIFAALEIDERKEVIVEYTVSQISSVLKLTLEETFSRIRVKGEISSLKVVSSGHIYFNLKDEQSLLNCACWKGVANTLPFKLEEGLEIICTGKISTFSGRSTYQLIVNSVEIAGVGALLALLEKRKQMLEAEGLFDAIHKKPLPFLPRCIGIITSTGGVVIRDILHRINERFPVKVIVWPVLVQGIEAADQIVEAIKGFNNLPENITTPDLIIVARGGGSIEDLMPFNEEMVVRAVAGSKICIISAIGHETDVTLIDHAADLRAPTPTAAAEFAVPVRKNLLETVRIDGQRIVNAFNNYLRAKESYFNRLEMILNKTTYIFTEMNFKLNAISVQLRNALKSLVLLQANKISNLSSRININYLQKDISHLQQHLENLDHNLNHSLQNILNNYDHQLSVSSKLLKSLHYKEILKRGFSVVWQNGQAVHRKDQIESSKLKIEFSDGNLNVKAERFEPKPIVKLFNTNVKQENLF